MGLCMPYLRFRVCVFFFGLFGVTGFEGSAGLMVRKAWGLLGLSGFRVSGVCSRKFRVCLQP